MRFTGAGHATLSTGCFPRRSGIISNQLDEHPDLLAISFHALDYVGHSFGPNSREVLDTILRLDRTMGELFDFIDQQIGLDNVVNSLSADHGVAPIPAYRRSVGEWAERADSDDVACFQNVGRALRRRYGNYDWLRAGLYLNDDAIEAARADLPTPNDTRIIM